MAAYSVIDALSTLCTSVPDWNTRLEDLKGQISLRQIELARLEEGRAAARSLRNKGSTESLRPKDNNGNGFPSEDTDRIELNTTIESPKPIQNGFPVRRPSASSTGQKLPAIITTSKTSPTQIKSFDAVLTRQSSQPTQPTYPRVAPAALKKRKTESLASGQSITPKYRTRSMIIVYYDSAVQIAFEDLVKFVSVSRNLMRKGKMAMKMAEMRRAAELEVEADDDAEREELNSPLPSCGNSLAAQKRLTVGKAGEGGLVPGVSNDADFTMPKLRYMSTTNMGPERHSSRADNLGSTLSVGLLRGYWKGADASAPDIFSDLDKGLEWCQSQCEHAAHQFLRDGDCNQEIENIKRKLLEVREIAAKEVERLREKGDEAPPKPIRQAVSEKGRCRELKTVQMRKEPGNMKDLEVDDIEVDDEGVDDMEPPKLIFKRSRDVGV